MPRKLLRVPVNKDIMKWARESLGIDIGAVAKRLGVTKGTVEGWEDGSKKPTLMTLQTLSSFYKRPLATFFLPSPPEEPPIPRDFRFLPEGERKPLSKKAHLAIRRTQRVQALATELMAAESTEGRPLVNVGKASLNDDPEQVAAKERHRLGISDEEQTGFKSGYRAFRRWRDALEGLNIVVYQARMRPEEIRGFSLLGDLLPTIVVSMSDSIHARIFTLFHEYAHLLLGISGICLPEEAPHDDGNRQDLERFCNHFSGAFLVPRHVLEQDEIVRRITRQSPVHYIDDADLAELVQRFQVSRQVILRRLLICEKITKTQYIKKLADVMPRGKRKEDGFGMPAPKRCISENGRLLISLALTARERELITYSDLSDYLSINLKHLDKVEALLHE